MNSQQMMLYWFLKYFQVMKKHYGKLEVSHASQILTNIRQILVLSQFYLITAANSNLEIYDRELYRTKRLAAAELQDSRTLRQQQEKFLELKTNEEKEFTKDPEQRNFKNYQCCVSANCAFWQTIYYTVE